MKVSTNNYRLTEATKARKTNKDTKNTTNMRKEARRKGDKETTGKGAKGGSEPPGRQ